MLLKFVTSCSRAPLLGFKHLQPTFTIHKVWFRSCIHVTFIHYIFLTTYHPIILIVINMLCGLCSCFNSPSNQDHVLMLLYDIGLLSHEAI